MLEWLLKPLELELMQRALVAAAIAGMICPIVGSYLIVQRLTLLGDVLTHTILPGATLAFWQNQELTWGALASGLLSTLAIYFVRSQAQIPIDAAMALLSSGFFAAGVMLVSLLRLRLDWHSFLFGDILSVSSSDVWRSLIIAALVLLAVVLFYHQLLLLTFDRTTAEAMGLPVRWLETGLMTGTTLTVIASMQTMGVVLVISLLVAPAIAAYLWVKTLHQMMMIGSCLGVIATVVGLYLSYYGNTPSGATIVLCGLGIFGIAWGTAVLRQKIKSQKT
ncbi:MAG: metal ABC transporter permease [Oscillatoriales cyanobacterium SM2_2_1]|nr:metal ABC transporter permease [Oscillatoriales cyanobacterium SM2_2_1]